MFGTTVRKSFIYRLAGFSMPTDSLGKGTNQNVPYWRGINPQSREFMFTYTGSSVYLVDIFGVTVARGETGGVC